ncbi:MAG: T9SS type A sorting domain-containing protein [Candidatus Cloacimonetes bacterium]|nr:T9SS type A sorting domain-containing protein [Candidatus Cloacimonadota bacterium]
MKKKIIISLISLLIIFNSILIAQTSPEISWTRTFGGGLYEWGRGVQQTTDGGYIIIGETYSFGAGFSDIWLIKTDSNGFEEWSQTFGDLNQEYGYFVQQTSDDGFIIAGTTSSYGEGGFDFWLIKTDSNGDEEWTKTFGGTGWEWSYSVQQTTDGGFVIVGAKDPTSMGYFNVWLIKTDEFGNGEWTNTYGGESADYGTCVKQTSDGGYIIVGDTYSFGAGSRDVLLIKTDSNGNQLWLETYGGTDSDGGQYVIQTDDSGYILTGYTKSFGPDEKDLWLIKTDSSGGIIWDNTWGGSEDDGGECVQLTNDGNYIIVGHTESYGAGDNDVYLIKADTNGETIWTKTIGNEDFDWGRSVQQTDDGGYIVVGENYSFNEGEYNIRLTKLGAETISPENELPHSLLFTSNLYNYPNPFNPTTTIFFETTNLHKDARIEIFNIKGQRIRELKIINLKLGMNEVVWNGMDDLGKQVSSGIYLYHIKSGNDFSETKQMLLMK